MWSRRTVTGKWLWTDSGTCLYNLAGTVFSSKANWGIRYPPPQSPTLTFLGSQGWPTLSSTSWFVSEFAQGKSVHFPGTAQLTPNCTEAHPFSGVACLLLWLNSQWGCFFCTDSTLISPPLSSMCYCLPRLEIRRPQTCPKVTLMVMSYVGHCVPLDWHKPSHVNTCCPSSQQLFF